MPPLAHELEGTSGHGQVANKAIPLFASKLNVHHVSMDRCNVLQGER